MSTWKDYKVEDCCDILDHKRVPLNKEQRERMRGDIPYYGANGVQDYINANIFDDDLILIAEDGGNFEQFASRPIAYRISGKSWVNNHAHVLRAKSGFDQDVIFYSLVNKNILSFIVGGTRSKLNQSELRSITLQLPDKEEQTAITDILATVDRAIAQSETLIAKQRRIKAGLLHDLLTRGIDEQGNLRDPATHRFKPSPVGLIPEEWGVGKVGDLFSMELGKMLSKASKRNIFPKLYLANKNVQWGRVDISDLDTMDFYPREQIRFRLKKGDILVCEGGEVGRTALWNDELDECYFQKAIHRLRPVNHQITPQFMMYYMQFVIPQGALLNLTTQTSIAHLTQEQLAVSPIVFPDIPEMNWITAILVEHDKLIKEQEADLNKLHRLKSGLMQDLLSGRVSAAGVAEINAQTSEVLETSEVYLGSNPA